MTHVNAFLFINGCTQWQHFYIKVDQTDFSEDLEVSRKIQRKYKCEKVHSRVLLSTYIMLITVHYRSVQISFTTHTFEILIFFIAVPHYH